MRAETRPSCRAVCSSLMWGPQKPSTVRVTPRGLAWQPRSAPAARPVPDRAAGMRRVTYQAGRDGRGRTTPSASIARGPRPGSPGRRRRSPRPSRRRRGMPRGSTVSARDRPPLGKGLRSLSARRDRHSVAGSTASSTSSPVEADRRHRRWPRPSASTLDDATSAESYADVGSLFGRVTRGGGCL